MRDVVWTRAAESDLQAAFDEAEKGRDGLGLELLELVDAAIELLRQFPEMAPVYEGPFRRLVIKNGKHGLFYALEARGLVLHAFADLRGNPEILRNRFRRLTGD